METEIGQVMVAGILIERQRCRQHAATTVRHTDHVQITLQDTVLARRAMDRDVRKIEGVLHAPARKRKIILINRTAVFCVPVLAVKDYDSGIVALLVHERIDARCRPQRHLMFATVSTGYDRYMSSHFIPNLQKRRKDNKKK